MKLILPTFAFWAIINDLATLYFADGTISTGHFFTYYLIHFLFSFYLIYIYRSQFSDTKSYIKSLANCFLLASFIVFSAHLIVMFL